MASDHHGLPECVERGEITANREKTHTHTCPHVYSEAAATTSACTNRSAYTSPTHSNSIKPHYVTGYMALAITALVIAASTLHGKEGMPQANTTWSQMQKLLSGAMHHHFMAQHTDWSRTIYCIVCIHWGWVEVKTSGAIQTNRIGLVQRLGVSWATVLLHSQGVNRGQLWIKRLEDRGQRSVELVFSRGWV